MPLLPNMETSDYLDILRRRKWYIVFSILFVLFGASVYSVVAPEKYKSSTTILVIAQRVPEGYVRSTISTRVDERLFTIRQQVLSRTRLIAVMEELGLYKEERKKLPAEEVVEMMRKSIDIQVASATDKVGRRRDSSEDAFTLTVTHGNPQSAMMTASRLASYFIDENLKSREQQAAGTSEFLESQLQETKVRLEAQEEKVKQYKLKFMGELPQQLQANLQILSRLQDQMKMNSDATRNAQDRKVYLEAQIGVLESQSKAFAAQLSAAGKAAREAAADGSGALVPSETSAAGLANELSVKKSKLAELSGKYTEKYPEIRRLKEEVAKLEKRLAEAIAQEGSSGKSAGLLRPPSIAGPRDRDEIFRLHAQSKALDSEITSLRRDRLEIGKAIAGLEARVEKSPRREQEMVSLTRDYENLKLSYDDLLKKKLDAEVSQNLEKRQKGEQFQILDPADLPQEPFTPNRPKVLGIAFAAALLIGFGGAIGFEMINPTLRGKRDFQHFFKVPVLASIPIIRDTEYEARKSRQVTVVYGGLISFGALVTLFLVFFGQKVRNLLQGIFT
ncbi:MAG TPA: Wzz/FepE/Etk N-terminal domain-containing protein [Terriglobales bacterium]|nr:Wzz/FepE/Etk N-terminal domain-containing protein [Terriglobales bacterium]